MNCTGCSKGIKKNERVHRELDGKRLKALWHLKCWHTHLKRTRWAEQGRARETVTPYDNIRVTLDDVQQREALAARQAELQEQRDLEDSPRRFDDWRQ